MSAMGLRILPPLMPSSVLSVGDSLGDALGSASSSLVVDLFFLMQFLIQDASLHHLKEGCHLAYLHLTFPRVSQRHLHLAQQQEEQEQ
jgi:hypothetical protein